MSAIATPGRSAARLFSSLCKSSCKSSNKTSTTSPPTSSSATKASTRLLSTRQHQHQRGAALQSQREDAQYRRSMQQSLKRDWQTGDVYAPHDLSAAEMRKWSKRQQPTRDVFDILSVNPLSLYKNFSVMSDFVSEMGRIRPVRETGLRLVNQRKVAKAVRRAIAFGLMPSVHKHPEILKRKRGRF